MSEKFEQAARLQIVAAFKQASAGESVANSFKMMKVAISEITAAIGDATKVIVESLHIMADKMASAGTAMDIFNQKLEYAAKLEERANDFSDLESPDAKKRFKPTNDNFLGGIDTVLNNLGQTFKGIALTPFKAIASPFKTIGKIGKGGFKAMQSAFATMGPQMMVAAMAGKVLMAGFEAMMEPFEVLSDLFEAFGSILSQLMIPIVEAMMPTFTAMIPMFQQLVIALLPVVDAFLKAFDLKGLLPVMEAVIPLIVIYADALTLVLNAITPLTNFIIDEFLVGIEALLYAFEPLADFLSVTLTGAVNAILAPFNSMATKIGNVRAGIDDWIDIIDDLSDSMSAASTWIQNVITSIAGFFSIDTSGWW